MVRARLFVVTLALAAAVLAATQSTASSRSARTIPVVSFADLTLPARHFRDAVIARPTRAGRSVAVSGGTYVTPDGVSVQLFVSDSYAPREEANQALVNFLGSLLHGKELQRVRIYVETPDEVRSTCGGVGVIACYAPLSEQLYVPGDESQGLPLVQVLAHEYGHHVARNRSNDPWFAGSFGPKRWASYMNVCAHTRKHELYPGDQGIGYKLNPGEGWAEVYRRLNEQRAGTWPGIGWPIVDEFFEPNATALARAAQDVLQPWSGPTRSQLAGRVGATGKGGATVRTPLDGSLRITVAGVAARGTLRTQAGRVLGRTGTDIRATVCGQRTLKVSVRARPNTRFRLSVLTP